MVKLPKVNLHICNNIKHIGQQNMLSKFTMLSYCAPAFMISCYMFFVNTHLTKFYLEDVKPVRLSPAEFGICTAITSAVSLFFDFFISYVVDVIAAWCSSLLPIILVLAPLSSLCDFCLFAPPEFATSTHLALWFLFFSSVKNLMPLFLMYNSLAKELLAESPAQRETLFAMKHWSHMMGYMLGGFLPIIFSALFGRTFDISDYKMYMGTMSTVLVCAYAFMAWQVRHVVHRPSQPKRQVLPLIVSIKMSFQNRAFRSLLYLQMYTSARFLLWNSVMPLYYLHVLQLHGKEYQFWTGIMNMSSMIAASVAIPVITYFGKKFGNYKVWIISMALSVPVGISLFATVSNKDHMLRFVALEFFWSGLVRGSNLFIESMKANACDYDELYSGQQRGTALEASWALFPKYIALPGSMFSMKLLEYYGGYKPQVKVQDSVQLTQVLAAQAYLLPALSAIGSCLIMYSFPITDSVHAQVRQGIKNQKEGNHIVVDPLTNKIIPKPAQHQDTKQKHIVMHFFKFELRSYSKKPFGKLREQLWCAFWIVTSLCLCVLFAYGTMIVQYYKLPSSYFGTGYNTFYLWLAAVSFATCVFHYLRIEQAEQLATVDADYLKAYCK